MLQRSLLADAGVNAQEEGAVRALFTVGHVFSLATGRAPHLPAPVARTPPLPGARKGWWLWHGCFSRELDPLHSFHRLIDNPVFW